MIAESCNTHTHINELMEAHRRLYPTEFLRKFVAQGVRPDGRRLTKFRKAAVTVGAVCGSAVGSALVKLGNTTVLAGVRAELGPQPVLPLEGSAAPRRVAVNVDLPPLCSPRFRGGRLPDEASVLAQRLNTLVTELKLVPADALAFDADGRLAWYLFVDVYCIDFDGAVFDACLAAVVAALRSVRLPRGSVQQQQRSPQQSRPQVQLEAGSEHGLQLAATPVATTFALFDTALLADPTAEEETLQTSALTVVCDAERGTICEIYKPGGAPLAESRIFGECIPLALTRAQFVRSLLDKALSTQSQSQPR